MTAGKAFIIGISGHSSAGKTTLSRLLRDIFPNAFILHQDDFYAPETEMPVISGLTAWDCPESIDFERFLAALDYIHENAALPPDLNSKEDQNTAGENGVGEELVEELKKKVKKEGVVGGGEGERKVVIVDGFLMFSDPAVLEKFDAKIFLRARYEKAKQRREARSGYVTLEGFWEDPPGYFDIIVWPSYVKAHKHLFVNEDVEGPLKPEVTKDARIHSPDGLDMPMRDILVWAVDVLIQELKNGKQ